MNRRGMTLVEMMVAVTATLLLMAAIAQIFSAFGTAVSDSRSVIELDSRMRAAAWKLRGDLGGVTAPTLPPLRPDQDAGYFEIIEGPNSDTILYYDPFSGTSLANTPFLKTGTTSGPFDSDDRVHGDTDDVLLFTTQNTATPFLGKFQTGKYESQLAEVAWFLRPAMNGSVPASANPATYTLHRRQLLVVGYVGAAPFASSQNMLTSPAAGGSWPTWNAFYTAFDLSARMARDSSGAQTYMPNTLADLTRRDARFLHNANGTTDGSGFPYSFPTDTFQDVTPPDGLTFAGTSREGEDVVLTNVIGFDVRVFDPTAPVKASGGALLVPGDPGFTAVTGAGVALGGYVDLGHGDATTGPGGKPSRVRDFGHTFSRLNASTGTARTWDTWSTHYETDGYDEDRNEPNGIVGIDQGANGLDDNGNGVVDDGPFDANGDGELSSSADQGELETMPPYPYPLRGIEVRLRCYEPSSRQVRQITIRHSFVQ